MKAFTGGLDVLNIYCISSFHVEYKEKFLLRESDEAWHGLPRELMESLFLEMLKKLVDVALIGYSGLGLVFGLVILEVFLNLNDSVILPEAFCSVLKQKIKAGLWKDAKRASGSIRFLL